MARKSKAESNVTTDHDQIRQWTEERGGCPAAVKRTRGRGHKTDSTGILRIDFPGYSGKTSLEEISWDEFFKKFDREKLAFIYQDQTATGERSNFNKLVKRSTVERRKGRRSSAKSTAARKKTGRRPTASRKRKPAGGTRKRKSG